MKKKLIIIGCGQQAQILASEIIEIGKLKLIGFLDFKENKKKIIIKNQKITVYKNLYKLKDIHLIIAVGDNYLRQKLKKNIENKYKIKRWYTFISPESKIAKTTKIGQGSIIMKGAIINHNSNIGEHCLINTGSIIEHDNVIEEFASIAPGAVTNGNVKIGKKTHLGSSSVVLNNIRIENDVVVGIGSVVTKDCKKCNVYFGNPSKLIRKRGKNEKYM
tara:strand:- start:67 stop:720 length:654 start_codon:yes stop_codon:yes gene_type:complete